VPGTGDCVPVVSRIARPFTTRDKVAFCPSTALILEKLGRPPYFLRTKPERRPMSNVPSQIADLIAAARKAQPGAVEGLLDLYRNYLRLVARTSIDAALRAKADPSDMVQETIIKAHENFGQFQGTTETELIAWLRQILANNIADLGRRYRAVSRQVSREVSLEDAIHSSADAIKNFVAGEASSPSHSYDRREMAVVLADALASLSPDHREVIILRSIEELDWPEIAQKWVARPTRPAFFGPAP
jgi:RNA polymerase sigma-70 factor (ECF subfamily)